MCTTTATTAAQGNHSSHHSYLSTSASTPPPINASQTEWLDYAAAVGEEHGIPGHAVTTMIKNKAAPNFGGSIPSADGSGERLYGPMLVHGGLLEGGVFAVPGGHGLYNEDGTPLSAVDLKNNPAAGIRAGVQHLKQLVEMYDGDLQKAINHYETGDPENSDHELGDLAAQCTDGCGEPTEVDGAPPAKSLHGHGSHGDDHDSPPPPATAARRASTPSSGGGHSDHGVTPPPLYTGSTAGPLTGNIDPGEGSNHPNDHVGDASHGHGFLLNADAHNAAMETMFGRPAGEVIDYLVKTLDSIGGYNKGQNEEQKLKGAYLIANLVMKHNMAPPVLFANETEAGVFYGQAKLMAMDNDADSLRDLIESQGGSTFGLGDAELINVWGSNEHNNLHAIMFGNRELANAVHMTSLNDNDGHEKDGMNPGLSGGYNNKGEYPQWGWFEGLQKISTWFPMLKPAQQAQAA
jgi:hypothetical protein